MTHQRDDHAHSGLANERPSNIGEAHDRGDELALQCHGDPHRLARLLGELPPSTKRAVLAAAHRHYGNAFVQRAVASHAPRGAVGDVTFEKTQSLHYYEGTTVVSESVSISIKAGEGPVHFAATDGALSVGGEHFHLSLKDGKAITGHLDIPGVTVGKLGSWRSKLKVHGGYVGVELGALYGLKGDGWTGNLSVSAFVGLAPVSKTPPGDPFDIPAPSLEQVIEACEVGLLAGIATAIATGAIVLA